MEARKSSFISPDSVAGAILGRVSALWGLIVFVTTMIVTAFFTLFTYPMKDPGGTETFRKIGRAWIHTFLFLTFCKIKRKGAENFKPGENYIVIVNHNALIDIPVSTPEIPGPNKTIAKIELSRIPIFGIIYKRGSVLVDRKNPESRRDSYRQMKAVLAQGVHMCIYPEGTRNKTDKPLQPFQDGAFKLSVETGKGVIPALLFNTKKVMPRHKPFFFWPAAMEMHFLPAVYPGEYNNNPKEMKEGMYQLMEAYYLANQ